MTAIGLVLMAFGWALNVAFRSDGFESTFAGACIVVATFFGGAIMCLAGVAIWLWRVMP